MLIVLLLLQDVRDTTVRFSFLPVPHMDLTETSVPGGRRTGEMNDAVFLSLVSFCFWFVPGLLCPHRNISSTHVDYF